MAQMSDAERDAFLMAPRIGLLAVLTNEGAPAAVPIWYDWDGQKARMFTSIETTKVARIRRDARVCLTVAEPAGVPESWVSIEGTASIETGGFELAKRLTPRYYAPDRAAESLAAWAESPFGEWVTIVIDPTRIRSSAPE